MKTNSSYRTSARTTLAALLFLIGLTLLFVLPFIGTRAQSQISGSVNPDGTGTNKTFTGTLISPGGNIMENTCVYGVSCEVNVLTVNGIRAYWYAAVKKIHVLLTWSAG